MSNNTLKAVGIVAIILILAVFAISFVSIRSAQIEANRAEQIRKIEYEESIVVEAQRTERTEERSQFWQKIVPWGDDEIESNSNKIGE